MVQWNDGGFTTAIAKDLQRDSDLKEAPVCSSSKQTRRAWIKLKNVKLLRLKVVVAAMMIAMRRGKHLYILSLAYVGIIVKLISCSM